ncbi:uncharacterized protein LOC119666139 [Teleopsis dalmanni]|uniref:uncharacterized protein LOC119666139 n=1 Tax=Teleopsis dalmanni TaxID=139649 RepID=UPI0018CDB4B1|nr:uncharacterized protein LOC119666139 [Teleopsis dalmanni]
MIFGKFYMPHQAVIRDDHSTTKVRVVFDASAKTTNGKSLNEILHTGPKLQLDIFQLLIKWRLWKYVMTADIEKMYRQVLVAEEDQPYQTILWREDPEKPIEEFVLKTVTYGTSCAPFLAKRALLEVAYDCADKNSKLYQIIKNDFYMDDLMTGADSIKECVNIQFEKSRQLEKFGFHLRKWMANEKRILGEISDSGDSYIIKVEDGEAVKTLGIQWVPKSDNFTFYIESVDSTNITKRKALSILARIYDPLGWLTPTTTMAKLFIQKLWLMNLTWDTKLDVKLSHEWNAIVSRISTIKDIRIPRWISTLAETSLELHGFADASEKAYAAVVYAKTSNAITILAAKSKVNPIKNKKTLPKLELCGAHLLGKLMKSIKEVINREVKIYAWSDSTIALSWIKNENKTKDKFIGTRVREIKQCMPSATWNHVRSEDNPADVASRGLKPEKLAAHRLWWNGPTWLKDESNWPTATESVLCATNNINSSQNIINDIIERYSNYRKLLYVIAYISRFIRKLKKEKFPVWLTVEELREAENIIIRHTQHLYFTKEINLIKNRRELPSGYKICSLYPFLDKNEILRVRGRLENSPFSFARKHPILLPKCHLTMLIVDDYHKTTLHGGIKLMENMLRRQYWIINARNIIKRYVRSCVRCIRYRRETATQLMGNLPESRVSISKPFEHAGIDYAEPYK